MVVTLVGWTAGVLAVKWAGRLEHIAVGERGCTKAVQKDVGTDMNWGWMRAEQLVPLKVGEMEALMVALRVGRSGHE